MAYAPEVVEVGAFGIAEFATLMLLLALVFLRFAWVNTLGALFESIGRHIDVGIPTFFFGDFHPFAFIAHLFLGANNVVLNSLGFWIGKTEYAYHRLVLWCSYILNATAAETAALAEDMWGALRWLYGAVSPAKVGKIAVQALPWPVTHLIKLFFPHPAAINKAAADVPHLAVRVARLERELAHIATGSIAVPVPHVPGIERDLGRLNEKIRRLGWLGAFAGLAGLGTALLARLGISWVRDPCAKRVVKGWCGVNPSLFETLLADTLLIVGTVSLVEFAKGMQTVVADVEKPVRAFWRAA